MNDETRQVIERIKDRKIQCPDCGKYLDSLSIEKYEYREFKVDYEKKIIYPDKGQWLFDDWAARCPHCGSLNIDSMVKDLEFETMV